MSRMTSKVWYWVGAGLAVPGLIATIAAFAMLSSAVKDMHRVVMPGKAEIVLPAGRTTLYAERRSVLGGQAYRAEGFRYRCAVTDPAGKEVVPSSSASSVSYSVGDYEGESAFDLDVPAAGTYVLSCEAPGSFVMAIGRGVGAWIVVMMVGAIPFGVGAIMMIVVLIKRRRQKRRAAAAAAAAAGSGA